MRHIDEVWVGVPRVIEFVAWREESRIDGAPSGTLHYR
jgi:hypothetical protein